MNCIRYISRLGRPDFQLHLLCHRQFSTSRRHLSNSRTSYSRYESSNSNDNRPPFYVLFGVGVPVVGITAASVYAYYNCLDYVPYTNRKRLLATTQEWEANMGHEQYKALLKQYQGDILPKDHRASVTVQRVGSRIATAAQKCSHDWGMARNKFSTPFTYTVVRSSDANAFVLPGNHVFVLTGLFKYCHDEDELASVLGHETAHNLARHAGERASEGLLMSIIRQLALILDPSGMLYALFIPAEQLFYTLPHSREHEMEADRIGIILASEACYDPRASKRVFSRMKNDVENEGQPPEFISTHPGYDTRLTLFDQWMPDALTLYNKDNGNKCRAIRDEMIRARRIAALMHDGKEGKRR